MQVTREVEVGKLVLRQYENGEVRAFKRSGNEYWALGLLGLPEVEAVYGFCAHVLSERPAPEKVHAGNESPGDVSEQRGGARALKGRGLPPGAKIADTPAGMERVDHDGGSDLFDAPAPSSSCRKRS